MEHLQSRAHIGHGVKHIGADDEIIAVTLKALIDARLLEIEHLVLDFGEGGQLLVGHGEEASRDVGESVRMHTALKKRQQQRGETASACADFQNAQSASFGQMARSLLQGAADARHPVAGKEAVAVEMIQQFGSRTGEQNLHRIFFSANDGAKLGTRRRAQQAFRKMSGMLRDKTTQHFRG